MAFDFEYTEYAAELNGEMDYRHSIVIVNLIESTKDWFYGC